MCRLYRKKADCCGCGACVDSCQAGALHMRQDREGFFYPVKEKKRCLHCGRCAAVCPMKNPVKSVFGTADTDVSRICLGAQAKDSGIRFSSASGGVFPVLAKEILRRRGSVYGAVYAGGMQVVHREIRSMERLKKMQGSKYVQSDLTGIYRSIEHRLKKGRWVLFCGTPCQSHALRLFLNQRYENLILVDLVCNGVSSPGLWSAYVRYLESRFGEKLKDFSFRDKRNHDNGHTCTGRTGNMEYAVSLETDVYCRMYFRDYISRPSCYACPFCTPERDSDITIGDFWGIGRVRPEMEDGMGTSMVILHGEKGRKLWESVRNQASWFLCQEEDLRQPRLCFPADMSKKRRLIMTLYCLFPISVLIRAANRGRYQDISAYVHRLYPLQEGENGK